MPTTYEDADYQEILRLFNRYTHDKSFTIDSIKNTAIPLIAKTDYFLDVGAGPGIIADNIQPFFKQTVVVEPQKNYAESLKARGYEVHESEFQAVQLHEKFDFILCSQVLYHVKLENWHFFISKMKELLTPGGLAMVVLGAARGPYYDFCRQLNPNYGTGKQIIEILEKNKIDFHVEKKQAYYYPESLDEMYNLCRFSVLEGCLNHGIYTSLSLTEQEEIDRKIMHYARQCLTVNHNYELFFERDLIYFRSTQSV